MKRVYLKIQTKQGNDYRDRMVDGYLFAPHIYITKEFWGKGWQVSHSCGLLMCPFPLPTRREAIAIARKLLQLVPDWSDAATESKGEKYFLARNYLRELESEHYRR